MKLRESVAKMKRAVAAQFPEDAAATDAQMEFFDEDAYETWLERFCDTTNAAMARRDEQRVIAHLSFMSQQLELADNAVRCALDVAYVENLMWNLDLDGKRWAWPRIPSNLKQLYLDMWGQPEL
ncbi:MAG: hypothetical protein JOY84_21440 [Curvibacter sp.]|nr:hypothetical protein [Curvibacter sp.]